MKRWLWAYEVDDKDSRSKGKPPQIHPNVRHASLSRSTKFVVAKLTWEV
jgi:hypothetical protein